MEKNDKIEEVLPEKGGETSPSEVPIEIGEDGAPIMPETVEQAEKEDSPNITIEIGDDVSHKAPEITEEAEKVEELESIKKGSDDWEVTVEVYKGTDYIERRSFITNDWDKFVKFVDAEYCLDGLIVSYDFEGENIDINLRLKDELECLDEEDMKFKILLPENDEPENDELPPKVPVQKKEPSLGYTELIQISEQQSIIEDDSSSEEETDEEIHWYTLYKELPKHEQKFVRSMYKLCKLNKLNKLKKLHEENKDLFMKCVRIKYHNSTPFFVACVQNNPDLELIKFLLDLGINVNDPSHRANDLPVIFHVFNYIADLARLPREIALGVRMNIKRKYFIRKFFHLAMMLYKHGLDENTYVKNKLYKRMNILMFCVSVGFPFYKLLEKTKVKKNAENKIFDSSPIDISHSDLRSKSASELNMKRVVINKNKNVVENLMYNFEKFFGSIFSTKNEKHEIHVVQYEANKAFLRKKLLEYPTAWEYVDSDRNSVLHYAVHNQDFFMVQFLCTKGCKVSYENIIQYKNKFNDTALIECGRSCKTDESGTKLFNFILQKSKETNRSLLNHQNVNKDTCLHYCCRYGKLEFVKLLLNTLGCSIFIKNLKGLTPKDELKTARSIYNITQKVENNGVDVEEEEEEDMRNVRYSVRQQKKITEVVNDFSCEKFLLSAEEKKKYQKIIKKYKNDFSPLSKIIEEMKDLFKMNKYNPFHLSLIDVEDPQVKYIRQIGEGGQSTVSLYEVNDEKMAFIKLKDSYKDIARKLQEDIVLQQFLIQIRIDHVHVIRFRYFSAKPLGFFLDYCEEDVYTRIRSCENQKNDDKLTPEITVRILKQTAKGMKYLHKNRKICHQDLKWENVMLRRGVVKIIDFGMARKVRKKRKKKKRKEIMGSSYYISPEVLNMSIVPKEEETKKDVYAFAFMLYEIMHIRTNSFRGYTIDAKFYERLKNDPHFRPVVFFPDECMWLQKIIRSCWNYNYAKRYTFEQILELFDTHPEFERNIGEIRDGLKKMKSVKKRRKPKKNVKGDELNGDENDDDDINSNESDSWETISNASSTHSSYHALKISYQSEEEMMNKKGREINLNKLKQRHDRKCNNPGQIRSCWNCSGFFCTTCIKHYCDECGFDICDSCVKRGKFKDSKRKMCVSCAEKLFIKM